MDFVCCYFYTTINAPPRAYLFAITDYFITPATAKVEIDVEQKVFVFSVPKEDVILEKVAGAE